MRYLIILAGIVGIVASSVAAQPDIDVVEEPVNSAFVDAMVQDAATLRSKLVGLAEAMPDEAMAWAPSDQVLPSAEVFMHIAAYNYYYPSMAGAPIPSGVGVTAEYATVSAFQTRDRTRSELIEDLRRSFEHLEASVSAVTADQLDAETEVFGRSTTVQAAWYGTMTHIHEHLGQLVAYARANGVTPPWSM